MPEYQVVARFDITEKETGKTFDREINTCYNSGAKIVDENTVARKCLQKAISDISQLCVLRAKGSL